MAVDVILKCPKCGAELELDYEGVCSCLNNECDLSKDFDKGFYGTNGFDVGALWQERCIKAEAELDISKKEYAKQTDKLTMRAMALQGIKERIETFTTALEKLPKDKVSWEQVYLIFKNETEKLLKGCD